MALAKLTTLTPVHIGSGEKLLRDFDFIIEGKKIGFIDLEKVVSKIGFERLPQLTAEIEKKTVGSYLKRTIQNFSLEDICYRVIINKTSNSNCNELKAFYFTSLLDACLPGSSLKGSLKTAIWETIATKEKQISWKDNDYKNKKGKFNSDNIDKKIFGSNANEKTTRFLKVGDIHFPGQKTEVHEIGILNAGYNNWDFKSNQSFLAECLPANVSGSFSFNIDELLLKRNNELYPDKWQKESKKFFDNRLSFCQMVNNYTSRQLGYELDELGELEYEGFGDNEAGEQMLNRLKELKTNCEQNIKDQLPAAIVRIGGNSGWNFTTGGWVKSSPMSDVAYTELRKVIQKRVYNMGLWPKTRKLTKSGIPLGFIKISLSE